MQVFLLYAAVVLIWGSTWSAIPFQLGVVAVEVSVAYRFGLAAIVLYLYAVASRRQLLLPARAYPFVFVQGVLLFCINYFLVYYGTAYLTSGVVAVLFSSILAMNAVFERLFFGKQIATRFWVAAVIGITGISLIFWSEISGVDFNDNSIYGGMLVLFSTLIASLGNMAAVVNTNKGLPVVAVNAHAMAFAAVLAFGCYLALLRRIGASRASYSTVLFPIVALLISTFIEGYHWTTLAFVGMLLTLAGNWLILSQRKNN
jgi:drug/metabolite transporter (DMT)-like permease